MLGAMEPSNLSTLPINSREYASWLYDEPEERMPSNGKGIGNIDRFRKIISFERALAQKRQQSMG